MLCLSPHTTISTIWKFVYHFKLCPKLSQLLSDPLNMLKQDVGLWFYSNRISWILKSPLEGDPFSYIGFLWVAWSQTSVNSNSVIIEYFEGIC